MSEPAGTSSEHLPDEAIRRRHEEDPEARARGLDALDRVRRGDPPGELIEPEDLERFLGEQA